MKLGFFLSRIILYYITLSALTLDLFRSTQDVNFRHATHTHIIKNPLHFQVNLKLTLQKAAECN